MRSKSRPRFQLSVTGDDGSAEKGRVEDQVERGLPVGLVSLGEGCCNASGRLVHCEHAVISRHGRWRRGSFALISSAAAPRIGQLALKFTF
jgi:hypothetical protein